MELVPATEAEFDVFLTKYGYSAVDDKAALLALSFAFLSTLPFCSDAEQSSETTEAQCFIAYSMGSSGGGFNPAAMSDIKTLTKKGLGRGAINKEYVINDLLVGTEPLAMLRTMPLAYGLLKSSLCAGFAVLVV